ncbi:uncharacterized protein LOC100183906 isoform X2 [Ciona intestinalis]
MPIHDYNRPEPNSTVPTYNTSPRYQQVPETYPDKLESSFTNASSSIPPVSRQGRRRFLESREGSRSRRGPYHDTDAAMYQRRGSLPMSRRQRRNIDAVSTVAEDEDDDVFVPTSPPKRDKEERNENRTESERWAEVPRAVARKDDRNITENRETSFIPERVTSPRVQNPDSTQYGHPQQMNGESRPIPQQQHFSPRNTRKVDDATSDQTSTGLSPPYVTSKQLPPLKAEHISSMKETSQSRIRSPVSSCISLASSATSVGKQRRSGKRVAFASRNEAEAERAFSPKREKIDDRNAQTMVYGYPQDKQEPNRAQDVCRDPSMSPEVVKHHSLFTGDTLQSNTGRNDNVKVKEDLELKDNRVKSQEREPTTIHVGDIDVKSDRGNQNDSKTFCDEHANDDTSDSDSSNSGEDSLDASSSSPVPIDVVAKKSDAPVLADSANQKAALVEKSSSEQQLSPTEKSKSSFWQLAKNLQKKMGTKLNLRRERSKMSSLSSTSGDTKSLGIPTSQKLGMKQELKQTDGSGESKAKVDLKLEIQSSILNNDDSDCELISPGSPLQLTTKDEDKDDQTTSDENKQQKENVKREMNKLTSQSDNIQNQDQISLEDNDIKCNISASSVNATTLDQGGFTEEAEETRDEKEDAKHFYEEEMKMAEQKKKNDERTNKLVKEQQQMEDEIINLRKILSEELKRQSETNEVGSKFDEKIGEIEKQLDELDKKMTDTNEKLKETEMERMELKRTTRIASGETTDVLPGNTPLFILGDPKNGTAAAVTQGAYCDSLQDEGMLQPQEISYYNHSTYQGSLSPPSSYTAHQEALEETKKQQEQLKEDLEMQMALLKAELEQQLQEQRPEIPEEVEFVIDARVTNLEMQIAEMNKKIMDTDLVIQNADMERWKAKQKMELERRKWEEEKMMHEEEKRMREEELNRLEEEELKRRAEEQRLREIENNKPNSERKLLRMPSSPKVSPISLRRNSGVDETLNEVERRRMMELLHYNGEGTPKVKKKQEEIKLETLPSNKIKTPKSETSSGQTDIGKQKKSLFKSTWPSSSDAKSKTTSNSKSAISSDALSKVSSSDAKQYSHRGKGVSVDREMTITTIESDLNQLDMETTPVQSRGSDWATSSGRRTGTGWGGSRHSMLEGLGTSWCVCPKQIWKHLGDENDDEPVTRRKCISVIMAVILALLLLSIVIGLIIGIVSNIKDEPESPIKFVVIPGTDG